MRAFFRDVRYALRLQRKRPGLATVMIAILALGIGIDTAIFNLLNAMLLRPLPYAASEGLVALHAAQLTQGTDWDPISPLDLRDWRERNRVFADLGSFARAEFNLGHERRAERIQGARVSANLFPLLGIEPVRGRGFTLHEDRPGGDRVVLLSHALWQRRFDGDPEIVGRTLRLNGVPHAIVGVMPPRFEFPEWAKLWTPLALDWERAERTPRYLDAMARLRPGVTPEQAQSDLAVIARELEEEYPATNRDWGARVRPLRDELMPLEARAGLYLMLAAVSLVLFVVCANVATLRLSQVAGRRREHALRQALGASRLALARQLLTESLTVSLGGGVLGIAVSLAAVRAMVAAVPVPIPFWIHFDLDPRILLFTLVITLLAGVVFGLGPALVSVRARLVDALKEGTHGARGGRFRQALVGLEIALSVVLVIAAMLMLKGFLHLQQIDRGYEPRGVSTLRLTLEGEEYETTSRRRHFADQLLERVTALADVSSAGLVDFLPTSRQGYVRTSVAVEGRRGEDADETAATLHGIAGDYFATLGFTLLRGRFPSVSEIHRGDPVAVVSRSLAERLWPETDPVGRRLRPGRDPAGEWLEVVGVLTDVEQAYQMGGIDTWPDAQLYVPLPRTGRRAWTLVAEGTQPPDALVPPIRAAVAELDPNLALFDVLSLEEVLRRFEWLPRFWGQMFTALAVIAVLIALLGIYGITAYAVSQRGHEIGLRMALGARPAQVVGQVLAQGMTLVATGLGLGLVLAWVSTGAMSALLLGVSPTDPPVYLGVTLFFTIVAVAANYLPARRALRVDPLTALRYE